jgi:hypothetical protein
MSADGSFAVAWNVGQVKGRAFSSTGAPFTAEFLVNTITSPNAPRYPTVAMAADGDFVVSWEDLGAAYDIFARRFVATATLDIDGDGEVVALTDGLLALRWMFDFTGAVLIAGAVDGSDCTRCTAPSVDSYLASIESLLDIDDDGQVEPLTDGLLVLRWLFGFTGSTLVSGAVDPVNCGRCNAAAIEPYLATID